MTPLEPSPRRSGLILHPTSLPGRFGLGDLGPEARRFVDVLSATGQQLWQILPLGPVHEEWFSPYAAYSAFAGNPLLLSPEVLCEQGLLSADALEEAPPSCLERVDFGQAIELKWRLLAKASQAFFRRAPASLRHQFEQFQHEAREWLDDYALYMAIRQGQGRAWRRWEEGLRRREPGALEAARRQLAEDVLHQQYLQFEFHRQWGALKTYANSRGVRILGDVSIYVSQNSADVWAHREYFQLSPETFAPAVESGTPPDGVFSTEGQRWGMPVYDWQRLAQEEYRWWAARLRQSFERFDHVRLDHFGGFESYWAIPSGSPAREGRWAPGPGKAFFDAMRRQLGPLPVVVEDLGFITPAMRELRDAFGFPGMCVLQYAFKQTPDNPHLPYKCRPGCVIYTGTHDTNTAMGWFQAASAPEQRAALEYLGGPPPGALHWALIRQAWSSVAQWSLAPLQDVMGLGAGARMNHPGTAGPLNWSWRFRWEQLPDEVLAQLALLTKTYGRLPIAS
ncbi:4-alpha-glucanotransferase [Stigmatella aurantiaca]|nr:4-alpha-glucanotransferase [Stigmatella aurantiaca]ADO69176.1 4-alpha-glucanotransferase [Stigmatella aurantiaca DW4/3-1]